MTFQQFLDQYDKLKMSFPRRPNYITECENSDYGNYLFKCKNIYFGFESSECEDCTYIFDSFKAVNCCDGDYVIESQNCYDSVDAINCNNCTYINYCSRVYDSHFCWNCSDSHNLFGCYRLQMNEYCIFNKQYTKEEYEKKVAELKKRLPEENLKQMRELSRKFPVTQTHIYNCENCDYGNQVFHSKNLYLCFDSVYSEDSAYLYDSHYNKSCFDLTQTHNCERIYESVDTDHSHNSFNLNYCSKLTDCGFCQDCESGNNLFGCVNLKNQEYCFLNKKYSKEEYENKVREVMKSMVS